MSIWTVFIAAYALGVPIFGVYHLVPASGGRAHISAGGVDMTYLAIAGLALGWPFYVLVALAMWAIGKDRIDRLRAAMWLRRGFYYENVRQPDGTYSMLTAPLHETGPCAICTKVAPKCDVRISDETPSTSTCLCPDHRTDEDIATVCRRAGEQ
jgi:hypothetical protein